MRETIILRKCKNHQLARKYRFHLDFITQYYILPTKTKKDKNILIIICFPFFIS